MKYRYQSDVAEVLKELQSSAEGLSPGEAADRLARNGPNQLVERGSKSPWLILWEQLTAVMMIILIVAAVISAVVGDVKDAAVILIIVVLNALLGFSQEFRAEKAMAALKKLAVPKVRVRRGGEAVEIPSLDLVAGDIVLLEAGNIVPADCRMVECANLRIQESTLTGESDAVEKDPAPLNTVDPPLGDQKNMGFMGTIVTYGRGTALVVETGMRTELGHIAEMIQTVKRELTPMQKRMEQLGRGLAAAALVIVGVIFAAGMLRGEELRLMFMTAITMAVAAVPEGLPAVMTVSLALGARRMLKRRALIRKLPAVETLGSITVICSDKTGTLTQNQMTVTVLDVAGHRMDLTPDGSRTGIDDEKINALRLLLAAGALCNDAELKSADEGNAAKSGAQTSAESEAQTTAPSIKIQILGDPTETSLVAAAHSFDLSKSDLEKILPRVGELPFDSDRKRMTTIHELRPEAAAAAWLSAAGQGASRISFTKGSLEGILGVSGEVWHEQKAHPLDASWRSRITAAHDALAAKGMRVLGLAFKTYSSVPASNTQDALEAGLVFIGMAGIIDPPRPEVKKAVEECLAAGIRPVMITGDHPLTAGYIAGELGIAAEGRILTGRELAGMSDDELKTASEETRVYARVSPEHKLRIIQAFQDRGHIVAMTGDGVNDAPALRKADIGIAMGITGTDVSKEACDMVLLDDNFATIVAAIREGRTIYDNIRKFIKYLLTTNSGELWVMFAAPFLGMPLPLLPIQILWVNLMSDGLPALALSAEPAERDVMRRAPFKPDENLFGRGMGIHILWVGLFMAAICLGTGYVYWRAGDPAWQTVLFTMMSLSQLAHVMVIRSERQSIFQMSLFSNRPLVLAVLFTFIMHLVVIYVPFMQDIFKTAPLSLQNLAVCLAMISTLILVVEVEKWFSRKRTPMKEIG